LVVLVVACAVVGVWYGRIPAAVARRVFAAADAPLLVPADALGPPAAAVPGVRLGVPMQLLTGALFAGTAAVVGTRWVLPAFLWMVAVTVTLTLTDLDRKLIPNRILFPGTAIAAGLLVVGALVDGEAAGLLRALAGGAGYFVFLLVVALAARGGFGMGDVKLSVLLGIFLAYESWAVFVVGVVGAFVLGGAVSLVLLVFRIKGRKDAIPFGPYLVAGTYLALAAGEAIADWYRG
jgi:leader peptidase (prepilin peptidase)/N-methyltransferase